MAERRSFKFGPWLSLGVALLLLLPIVGYFILVGHTHAKFYAKLNTEWIIQTLDEGCKAYKAEYGSFPSNDRGDSRCLHFYLGSPRLMKPPNDSAPGPTVKMPPFVDFPVDWLQLPAGLIPDPSKPSPIIDSWGNPIKYANPGRINPKGVDIWSSGPNGKDELDPKHPDFDDITNWQRDY